MKYLVYGIMPEAMARTLASFPSEEEGEEVRFIAADGLAAACVLRSPETEAQVSRLAGFARMIESLWRRGPILPMRYGCWLDSDRDVAELLQRRKAVFAKTLQEVDGCAEMGIRVKPAQVEPAVVIQNSRPNWTSGASYLAQRQAQFAAQDRGRLEAAGLTESICAALAGLFVKSKTEGGLGLLSLYFLVRADQVDSFRMTFRQLQTAQSEQLLLSGPWPPYNFVAE